MTRKKQKGTKKTIAVFSIVAVLATGALVFYTDNTEPPLKPLPVKVAQYSDKNITQNAIVADPRFETLAFEKVPEKDLISSQLASVFDFFQIFFKKTVAEKETGTWVWTPVPQITKKYADSIISKAKNDGVDTIYLSVDSYLDIFVTPKSTERDRLEQKFNDNLKYFITIANINGITVDAEAGWRNWAEEGHFYKPLVIANFVKDFNAKHQNKFRSLQYDIEPYLLPDYEKEPERILKNFVTLVDQTKEFLKEDELRLSIVIPEFYDRHDEMTPKFSYGGKKDYVLNHLFRILDDKNDSSIITMSYRNFAEGFDGSIAISQNEMKTAKKHKTKVVIAQETGQIEPTYLTFHGTSRKHLSSEVDKVRKAFDSNPNFGGIAFHYANSFFDMK